MAEATLEIDIETKQALKDMAKFQKKTVTSIKAVESSFSLLKAAAGVAVGVFAGRKLIGGIEAVTDAASVQEDAINQLNTAFKITGKFTEEASKDFQEFASSIQETTKFGDEALLQNAALIQSLGDLSTDGLKEATKAAADMSAALGIDLTAAATLVGKAAAGEIGSFSRYGVVIKKGADNAETFSKALDALNSKFGGSAAAQVNTFSGALQQTQNTFGDLQEELGFLITRNPIVIKGIKVAGDAFRSLIKIVSENKAEIGEFVGKAFKGIVNAIPSIIKGFKFLFDAFRGIGLAASSVIIVIADFIGALLKVDIVADIFNQVIDAFKGLAGAAIAAFSVILDGLSALGVDVGDFQQTVDDLGISLIESIGSDAASEVSSSLDSMRESALQFGTDTELAFVDIDKAIAVVAETAQTVADEVNKIDLSEKIAATVDANVEAVIGPSFFSTVGDAFAKVLENIDAKKVGVGFVQSALKGTEGARNGIKKGFETIGESFLPGFGGAIGEIAGELTKGPEHVRSMVEQFVEALPILIEAFAEALPVIIETLAAKSDEIILAIIQGIPKIILALVQGMPRIITELVKASPAIVRAIAFAIPEELAKQVFSLNFDGAKLNKIIGDIGTKIQGFFTGLLALPGKFLSIIGDGLKKILDKLNPVSGVKKAGGAISKAGSDVADFLGFAEGGVVPGVGNADTFPAALTPGELVVPKDDVTKLRSFLNNQNQGSNSDGVTTALLSQVIQLLEQPMNVSTTAEVDGEALANIMLDLSRQNARVA